MKIKKKTIWGGGGWGVWGRGRVGCERRIEGGGGGGGGGVGRVGGVTVDVNEELKFLGKFIGGGGNSFGGVGSGGGQVGGVELVGGGQGGCERNVGGRG